MRLPLALASCLALSLSPVAAQTTGSFQDGDLFLASSLGLLRVDPLSGQTDQVVPAFFPVQHNGGACWDPHRKRVVFCGRLGGQPDIYRLHTWDDASGLDTIGFEDKHFVHLAPAGDGRIYLRDATVPTPAAGFRWLDGANRLHTLLDETGTVPFAISGPTPHPFTAMTYDGATNSLILGGSHSAAADCPGGSTGLTVRRIPLSADGTRVAGPVECAVLAVYSSSARVERISQGPGDLLTVVVDTNNNASEPRMLLLDPLTLAASVWATNQYTGAAATDTGTWSDALGEVVILDTLNDVLRRFAGGASGTGVVVPTTLTPSPGGSSGETATLLEVRGDGCGGAFVPYGVGLAGSAGRVPTLTGSGCPTPGGTPSLHLRDGLGGATGALFLSLVEASLAFKGGTLWLDPLPFNVPFVASGTPGVAGVGEFDAALPLAADPGLLGLRVLFQVGLVDAAAPVAVSLSQGLALEIG